MLLELRKQAVDEAGIPWALRIGLWGFGVGASRPWLYRAGAGIFRRISRVMAKGGWIRELPGLAGGWTRSRDLKAPAPLSFQELWRRRSVRVTPAGPSAPDARSAKEAAPVR
jgi:L-lactate dehydrogenase complex protein LldF